LPPDPKEFEMPQNWWEMYPEVVPSPAARPRLLPGAGGAMPGPAIVPQAGLPYAAIDPFQAPPNAFDPSYFAGDASLGGPSSQPLFSGDAGAPAIDRSTAIQHAAAAIQRGANPEAVFARLHAMGNADLDPPSPFSDLIPDGGRAMTMAGASTMAMPAEAQPITRDQGDFEEAPDLAGIPQQYRGNLRGRSDPTLAPQKADGFSKYFQSKAGSQVSEPAGELGRRVPALLAGAPTIVAGSEPKPPRPRGLSNDMIVSSPRTGGPRDLVPPRRSFSVTTHNSGGGLNGYGYSPQNGDAQLLARAIYSESGIAPEDMLAIGWSIVNRVGFRNNRRLSFGATLPDVVYQRVARGRHAYSFLDDGGSAAWLRSANPANIPDPAVWARAVAIANAILSRRASDPSGGAHYFFASPTYVPGDRNNPPPSDFPAMLRDYHYAPTPYQSASTHRDPHGRLVRNYFFRENPEKLWAPAPPRRGLN
jgi:hypothetical protein